MVSRRRKACDSSTKKSSKTKISEEMGYLGTNSTLSLPIISNEKLYCADLVKTSQSGDDASKFAIPKIKFKCQALNIEKIIDFKNNTVTVNEIRTKKLPKKMCVKQARSKIECKQPALLATETSVFTESEQKKSSSKIQIHKKTRKSRNVIVAENEATTTKEKSNPVVSKKKMKISNNEVTMTIKAVYEQESETGNNTETNPKHQNSLVRIPKNSQDSPSSNLSNENFYTQDLSICCLDDESAFIELSDINLNELIPSLEGISDEESSMKSVGKNSSEDDVTDLNILQKNESRGKYQWDLDQVNQDLKSLGKKSLLGAVEDFIKNPQVKNLTTKADLQKGLCFSWLTNKVCSNQHCIYSHNALSLFMKKLKRFPSKFIMTIVVSMRNDNLFVEVVMAAIKVISKRKIPVVWVTFLTFFVFYVTEPSDSRFLKFWANAARFFCELKDNYSTARGFASLLSIFSQGGKPEEWKIIEFIKLIRQPPVQVRVNFALLQPVLNIELPSEILIEAVESCIATQKDVLKVNSFIIPKIPIMTSSVHVVELLLKLCKVLEEMNQKNLADDLKQQLKKKVLLLKTKISHHEHPLAASFQEEISAYLNEENCSAAPLNLGNKEPTPELNEELESNYFQLGEDFCNLLSQTMELTTCSFPSPYRKAENICERQIARIKQFFCDCRFDLLGKYINELNANSVDRVAEECLKLLFQMKISLQQGVDFVKIVILPCKSESASKVIASISITLILNLVRINEWKKAYTIVSLCEEKNINLVEGKVFYFNEFNTVTQCRIVLLLIEIHSYKGNYTNAVNLVKKHSLFSPDNSFWQLTWKAHDETIRVKILEDLLQQIISNHLTEMAYDLFKMIWNVQKHLTGAVDLKKFVNEILILLFNEENKEAITLYEQIKVEVELKDTTIRAVVVSLVRQNLLPAAKSLVQSVKQNAYSFPEKTSDFGVMKVYSFWLEEEIFVVFDAFFDLLIAKKTSFNPEDYSNVEIQLHESKSNLTLGLRPLCLGIINPSFKDACTRIQRVLQYQFHPPVKLIIMPYSLKLDDCTLRLHLQKRIKQKHNNSMLVT